MPRPKRVSNAILGWLVDDGRSYHHLSAAAFDRRRYRPSELARLVLHHPQCRKLRGESCTCDHLVKGGVDIKLLEPR